LIQEQAQQFLVIDLVSQASAVASHVRGWSKEQILCWLDEHGIVRTDPNIRGQEIYFFSSRTGIDAAFYLDGDQFTFIVDNTTFPQSEA
jgi:hypothetical protein